MSSSPAQQEQQETERQQVAHYLSGYLQKKTRLTSSEAQTYVDKVRSGQHDDFLRQISLAREDEAQQILADLGGDSQGGRYVGTACR